VVGISRLSGGGEIPRPSGGDIEVNWWGELSRSSGGGNYQGQVVGISRSTGGGNYQGQVVGISRSSSGDIKAKWWGYQGQGEGLRGQGKKKVVGGACPLQLPLLLRIGPLLFYAASQARRNLRTILLVHTRNHFIPRCSGLDLVVRY
jgi:hypothetical protein